jgi:hypothetical protein
MHPRDRETTESVGTRLNESGKKSRVRTLQNTTLPLSLDQQADS